MRNIELPSIQSCTMRGLGADVDFVSEFENLFCSFVLLESVGCRHMIVH